MTLKNVDIVIPGINDAPTVESVDGVYQYNPSTSTLLWHLDQVDASNDTGTLEFNVAASDMDDFFPATLTFSTEETLCEVVVGECLTIEDDESINVGLARLMNAEMKVE